MSELVLYDFAESVCCQKVRLVIAEKQIEVTERAVPLDQGAQYQPEFLELNPKGIVPVAVHGDRVIRESAIINEYLEEVFAGRRLLPEDPVGRAHARYWSLLVDQGIHNPHTTVVSFVVALRHAFLQQLDTPDKVAGHLANVRDPVSREMQRQAFEMAFEAPAVVTAIQVLDGLLEDMDLALADSPWLAGDAPTLADFNLAPYVHRLDCLGLSGMWSTRSSVARWYEALQGRESWDTAIAKPHIPQWLELMQMGGNEAGPQVDRILAGAG